MQSDRKRSVRPNALFDRWLIFLEDPIIWKTRCGERMMATDDSGGDDEDADVLSERVRAR